MLSSKCLEELRTSWLPAMTDNALNRIVELLEKQSPFLTSGTFNRSGVLGCLATHAAWHHPATAHLLGSAGITWLHSVVGMNPAASHVIQEWDCHGPDSWDARCQLLDVLRQEQRNRQEPSGNISRSKGKEIRDPVIAAV